MEIMRPDPDHHHDDGDVRIVVESDDHEELVFHAMSDEEAEAKLDDFLTWAS